MKRRNQVAIATLAFALVGCGGGSQQAPAAPPSPGAVILSLQQSGAIPTLDVTTSLSGTDANNNGVRDDIDAYIAKRADSAPQKLALTQLAAAIQTTMTVDTTSPAALSSASLALNRGVTCIHQTYQGADPTLQVNTLEELSVNTMTRLVAYEKYNAARNGAAILSIAGNACN